MLEQFNKLPSPAEGMLQTSREDCMPPLPCPLASMATICWRDQVIVLGGRGEDDQVLNDVFMHDCKTGKITTLPTMLEKRCECCAVITGNTHCSKELLTNTFVNFDESTLRHNLPKNDKYQSNDTR